MPKHHPSIPMIRYLGYAALFHAKKANGMRAHRHRNFLIWKLVRLVESQKVDCARLGITSMGKTDGVGAQAMAKFSAMCVARAYGMEYVHVPFENLAHAELPNREWDAAWEQLLGMHEGNARLDPEHRHVVGLGEFIETPSLWREKVVIADRHFHAFCELAPVHGSGVAGKLRAAFARHRPPEAPNGVCRVGVHVRRGDVRKGDADTQHRFAPNHHVASILRQVAEAVVDAGLKPEIHLHSNGTVDELREFDAFPGLEYHAGSPAIETFVSLATSDVLIGTRSDFSMLAGVYNGGIVVCDPRHRTPLPEWLRADSARNGFKNTLQERLRREADSACTPNND